MEEVAPAAIDSRCRFERSVDTQVDEFLHMALRPFDPLVVCGFGDVFEFSASKVREGDINILGCGRGECSLGGCNRVGFELYPTCSIFATSPRFVVDDLPSSLLPSVDRVNLSADRTVADVDLEGRFYMNRGHLRVPRFLEDHPRIPGCIRLEI